jgi:hypothetical protein
MRAAILLGLSLLASTAWAQDPGVDRLLDRGVGALADGDLAEAERSFALAASLPGDRQELAETLVQRVRRLRAEREHPSSASIPFVVSTTVFGFALYGWSVPLALGLDPSEHPRGFVGSYMLGAAASFVVPFWLTRHHQVTASEANLAFYGGTRGAWHGLLLGSLLAGDINSNDHPRAWSGAMAAGSLLELAGGFRLASALDLSPGQVRTMAALGDLGLVEGFGAGYLLRFDEKSTVDARSRSMAAAGLVGSAVGLAGGYWLGEHRRHTWGDGEVLRAASGLGVWLGTGIADLAGVPIDVTHGAFTGLAMTGGLAGAVVGDLLVRESRFAVGSSLVVDLSTIAGGLAGAGATYIVSKGDAPILFASALGAGLGFGISYWASPRATDRHEALPRISLSPLALPGGRGLALAGQW